MLYRLQKPTGNFVILGYINYKNICFLTICTLIGQLPISNICISLKNLFSSKSVYCVQRCETFTCVHRVRKERKLDPLDIEIITMSNSRCITNVLLQQQQSHLPGKFLQNKSVTKIEKKILFKLHYDFVLSVIIHQSQLWVAIVIKSIYY